jgi:hypothetical protein
VVVFRLTQARFPDSRLERAASRPSQSFVKISDHHAGGFAIAGYSGGNRAGFTPASLVTLTGTCYGQPEILADRVDS